MVVCIVEKNDKDFIEYDEQKFIIWSKFMDTFVELASCHASVVMIEAEEDEYSSTNSMAMSMRNFVKRHRVNCKVRVDGKYVILEVKK